MVFLVQSLAVGSAVLVVFAFVSVAAVEPAAAARLRWWISPIFGSSSVSRATRAAWTTWHFPWDRGKYVEWGILIYAVSVVGGAVLGLAWLGRIADFDIYVRLYSDGVARSTSEAATLPTFSRSTLRWWNSAGSCADRSGVMAKSRICAVYIFSGAGGGIDRGDDVVQVLQRLLRRVGLRQSWSTSGWRRPGSCCRT